MKTPINAMNKDKDKPNKGAIRKSAKQMVRSGMSRQQVFDELNGTTGLATEQLAEIVRFIPSMEARKVNTTGQITLIGLLVFTILLKVLAAIHVCFEQDDDALPWVFLMPVVNIVLVIGVASQRGGSYRLVALFTVFGLLHGAASIFSGPLWSMLFDLCLAAALIGLSLFLEPGSCSGYRWSA